MRTRTVGWSAVLVECATPAEVEACRAALRAALPPHVEVVPGARTVLVDGVASLPPLAPVVDEHRDEDRTVEIPTVYDGPDLATVAEHWGVPVEEVIARHAGTDFRVAFCGFAPGFGYLTGLPEEWAVPRLATPRPRVPAGSVGLAGAYTGVYPSASPGGWLLVGRTDVVLFDVTVDPPALLAPGTRVRFRRVRA